MIELCISKDEVLRYSGCKNKEIDKIIEGLIEECIDEAKRIIRVRYVYKIFDLYRKDEKLFLKDSVISFESQALWKFLQRSESCALMAVTLGNLMDTRIRYYEKSDMARAVILDACATAAVEEACDRVCEIIKKEAGLKRKTLTSRFSPGYGDLPLDIQGEFISVLEADRAIGLTASAHNILIPGKSVTAIAGLIDRAYETENKGCLNCSKYPECEFRRRKDCCGNQRLS